VVGSPMLDSRPRPPWARTAGRTFLLAPTRHESHARQIWPAFGRPLDGVKLGRAMALRDTLQDVLATEEASSLHWWLGWAARSRLEPFRKLGRAMKNHLAGILAFMETRLTNAAIEAVNGILQMAKSMAWGFRNFHYFLLAAYLKAGHLNICQPSFHPLRTAKARRRGFCIIRRG
jgi:transposase